MSKKETKKEHNQRLKAYHKDFHAELKKANLNLDKQEKEEMLKKHVRPDGSTYWGLATYVPRKTAKNMSQEKAQILGEKIKLKYAKKRVVSTKKIARPLMKKHKIKGNKWNPYAL